MRRRGSSAAFGEKTCRSEAGALPCLPFFTILDPFLPRAAPWASGARRASAARVEVWEVYFDFSIQESQGPKPRGDIGP